jgi:hypothetical protein
VIAAKSVSSAVNSISAGVGVFSAEVSTGDLLHPKKAARMRINIKIVMLHPFFIMHLQKIVETCHSFRRIFSPGFRYLFDRRKPEISASMPENFSAAYLIRHLNINNYARKFKKNMKPRKTM